MTLTQGLFLGILQGVAELFPVSSLAQTILLPALLGWDLGPAQDSQFLAFVVALHLATAVALLIYFWNDWKRVLAAFLGSARTRRLVYDQDSKLAWLLVAGSIVVGLFGLIFEHKLRKLFEDPRYAWVVAAILVVNGIGMLLADLVKQHLSHPPFADSPPSPDPQPSTPANHQKQAEDLTLIEGTAIGATQALALLPGVSRSGVTIVSGLLAGLSYEAASRFSFMLGTVAIGLAAVLKVPSLFKPEARHLLWLTVPSALAAGVTAYLSTRFLMRYFKRHRLAPFGWYCVIFGLYAVYALHHA